MSNTAETTERIPALLLNCRQAAQALSMCQRQLWKLTKLGEIKSIRIGTRLGVRYTIRDLELYIEKKRAE